jgi:hypothetical protein
MQVRLEAIEHGEARGGLGQELVEALGPEEATHRVPLQVQMTRDPTDRTLGCVRRIFAEQLAGLTVRHGRRSLQLFGLLAAIGFALAGRAGARFARRAAIVVSRSTLLRVVRAAPEPTDVASCDVVECAHEATIPGTEDGEVE